MRHLAIFLLLLSGSDYRLALPGYVYQFPRDHGVHSDFKLEWWYWTGHLKTATGKEFGYELTFFRTGLGNEFPNPSRWRADDLYAAHFALSDLQAGQFHYFEKLSRPGPGTAGAGEDTLDVWIQDWSARLVDGRILLRASGGGIDLSLDLTPAKPVAIHGTDGVSQKAAGRGRASHYYSLTRLATLGQLVLEGETIPVSGLSWMDHEFGTNQLTDEQVGWDWLSLQLDNGEDLMIYGIRLKNGALDPFSAGTVVAEDGSLTHLARSDFELLPGRIWRSPRSKSLYPVQWRIRIPSLQAELRVETRLDNQELVTRNSTRIAYWEGAIVIDGTWRGREVKGIGYLEMTGYGEGSRPAI